MSFLEIVCEGLVVSTDPSRLDLDATFDALTASDPGRDLTRPLLARAVEGSLCFGVYDDEGKQVGFARVITDRATFAYVCDVYVLAGHGAGDMAAALVKVIRTHPDLQDLRRFVQATVEEELALRFFGSTTAAPPLDATLSPPAVVSGSSPPPKPRRGPPPPPPPDSPAWGSDDFDDSSPDAAPGNLDGPDDEGVLVRPLAEGEGELLRQLRLGALHDSPGSFGERLEDAANRPAEEWLEQARTLAEPDGPRLFIAEVDGVPAGLALVVEDPFDWDICRVGGMWVGPEKRRRGAGAGMLRAVRRWAQERDKARICLWVHEDAASARSLYESFGFSYTGAKKPFPREPSRRLLEMDLLLRPELVLRSRGSG
jgi:GNAT superfamily N-acetyltransferase